MYSQIKFRGEGTIIAEDNKSKNLHLPHDTWFYQDLCKINKLEPATRDNLD
jgi:glucan biosynthesis protein